MSKVNIGKIIVQEIQACSKKKEGMLYFPYLITSLCRRHGVAELATDEMGQPQAALDKALIKTLMKPKGQKRPVVSGQAPSVAVEEGGDLWEVIMRMQKDQRDFYEFQKRKFLWEEKMAVLQYPGTLLDPPLFPNHILGNNEADKKEKTLGEDKKKEKQEKGKKKKGRIEKKEVGEPSGAAPNQPTKEPARKKKPEGEKEQKKSGDVLPKDAISSPKKKKLKKEWKKKEAPTVVPVHGSPAKDFDLNKADPEMTPEKSSATLNEMINEAGRDAEELKEAEPPTMEEVPEQAGTEENIPEKQPEAAEKVQPEEEEQDSLPRYYSTTSDSSPASKKVEGTESQQDDVEVESQPSEEVSEEVVPVPDPTPTKKKGAAKVKKPTQSKEEEEVKGDAVAVEEPVKTDAKKEARKKKREDLPPQRKSSRRKA